MKSVRSDAVVIGSGFGGAAAARTLCAAGIDTVMLERGGWARRDDGDWDEREILLNHRYRSESPLMVRQYGDQEYQPTPANQVVGGQSVFYGGASLRLRENDFVGWPIDYVDLESHYSRAEQVLGVHGQAGEDGTEPWRSEPYPHPAPALTPPARRRREAAERGGAPPAKIPLAINFAQPERPRCIQCVTCDGFPCKIEAKNDVTTNLLLEAQRDGLRILPGSAVGRLVTEGDRVRRVECVDKAAGEPFAVEAGLFVVAAGALNSPAILLRSNLPDQDGTGALGCFLMRHCNAVVGYLFPFRTNPERIFHKQLCFTNFYDDYRDELGTAVGIIQDIYTPGAEVLRHFAPRGLGAVARFASAFVQNLLCIAEDDPQSENRVTLSDTRDPFGHELVQVTHSYSRNDFRRRDYLVSKARRIMRAAGGLVSHVYAIDTFSHVVGTCRMGDDPAVSVLDRDCRVRGVANLWVVDGSAMPTSGGVNPSLTVAANALRVSQAIVGNSD